MTNLLVGRSTAEAVTAEAMLRQLAKQKARQRTFDPTLGATYEEAAGALAAMRGDLARYTPYVMGLEPACHHRYWIRLIQAVSEGRLVSEAVEVGLLPPTAMLGPRKNKLLLLAPPNFAKSSYCSQAFPPWYLGRHPDHQVLFFTSSDDMANDFGTATRLQLEENERHAAVFPDRDVRPDKRRGWSGNGLFLNGTPLSSKDPAYRSRGWGARIVGARAHGIILDDVLDQVSSQSELEQRRAKSYYDQTVKTRLHPEGWLLAVATRWHEADLPSHFIEQAEEDGDWLVVRLPAFADEGRPTDQPDPLGRVPGEFLWPEREDLRLLVERERRKGTAIFNLIYQLDPTGLGGDVFANPSWFRPLPKGFRVPDKDGRSLRERLTVFQAWDLNFSEKAAADYSACATVGMDSDQNLYLLGMHREHLTAFTAVERAVRQLQMHGAHVVVFEDAAFRTAVVKRVAAAVREIAPANVQVVRPVGDKRARALLPAGIVEAGKFYADTDAPWWPAFLSEALGFPNTAFDDQVDALSLAAFAAQTVAFARAGPGRKRLRMETG